MTHPEKHKLSLEKVNLEIIVYSFECRPFQGLIYMKLSYPIRHIDNILLSPIVIKQTIFMLSSSIQD